MIDIISEKASDELYLSKKAIEGILRRKEQRKIKMNSRLEEIMRNIIEQE